MTAPDAAPGGGSSDEIADRFMATICHDAVTGDRPGHLRECAAFFLAREGAEYRNVQHHLVRTGERVPVRSEDLPAAGLGQFSYGHWPERVLRCLAQSATDAGCASALCIAVFDEEGLPRQWMVPVAKLAVGVNGPGHAFERWVIAPDMSWAVTIDENGVLRVFGTLQFVSDFARRYEGSDDLRRVTASAAEAESAGSSPPGSD